MPKGFWDSLPNFTMSESVAAGSAFSGAIRPRRRPLTLAEQKNQHASQAIISLAEAEAERIVETAHAEADRIYTEARERGLARGAEDARAEIEAQLTAQFNQRTESLQAEVASVLQIIEAHRVALWNNSEKEVLAFAMDVARKILKTEVQQNKNAIIELIRHSLRRVVDKDQLRIRVNPSDIETVRGQRDDLMLVVDGARHLDIIDDRRIEPGGCVIESAAGTIDAKIETQIEQIVQALELEQ